MSSSDPSCEDDDFSRQLRRAVRELPDAPPALQRAAVQLWPAGGPLYTLQAVAAAALRRVVAVLAFDSWAVPAATLGTRAPRSATTRHLLFSAEGRDIDLRVHSQTGALYSVAGQILGPDENGHVVFDPLAGGERHRVALDALGEFRAEGLTAGAWQVALELGEANIVLPLIELGEPVA